MGVLLEVYLIQIIEEIGKRVFISFLNRHLGIILDKVDIFNNNFSLVLTVAEILLIISSQNSGNFIVNQITLH